MWTGRTHTNAFRDDDLDPRTINNHMSNLRTLLTEAGRGKFVREQLSAQQLGIERGSRIGKKLAIPAEKYRDAQSKVLQMNEGVHSALALCRMLGLRSAEAVKSGPYLTLWLAAFDANRPICIIRGAKGKRARDLLPRMLPNKVLVRAALVQAIEVMAAHGGRELVNVDSGSSAINLFHRIAVEAGLVKPFSPHSLRYAFACDLLDELQQFGFTRRQASETTSLMLGHGDQRGRWVDSIYSRRALPMAG